MLAKAFKFCVFLHALYKNIHHPISIMKKIDFIVIAIVILCLLPFFLFPSVYAAYLAGNQHVPLCMAFLKFGILATFGEMLGLRLKTGSYYHAEFGLLPKFIIWGLLGMWIALAMNVFSRGIPGFLSRYSIFASMPEAMAGGFSGMKLLGAFCISVMMNTSFAPVFMTLHKVCDMHIAAHHGKVSCLAQVMPMRQYLSDIDWNVQWGFVFKKTIPLFWIPAHTLTFCLPKDFQVLFAAFCSIILGLFLSIAAMKKSKR